MPEAASPAAVLPEGVTPEAVTLATDAPGNMAASSARLEEPCQRLPLFLHGTTAPERLEVARRLHQHDPQAQGAFVVAALTEIPQAHRQEALFSGQTGIGGKSAGKAGWLAEAQGGSLLVDEIDCLTAAQQQLLMSWLEPAPGPRAVSQPEAKLGGGHVRLFIASRHAPEVLLAPGVLAPELARWLSGLAGRQVLGAARLRAIGQLAEGENNMGGLAGCLAPLMQSYLEAALETGVGNLHRAVIAAAERPLILHVLQYTQGNQIRAAALLGLNRNTLRKRLKDLNIQGRPPSASVAGSSRLGFSVPGPAGSSSVGQSVGRPSGDETGAGAPGSADRTCERAMRVRKA